ncbi:hypothetical protein FYK55_05515 [Roseiconus nitratireducens]|uniref:Uncharacterized protein n=1 Tax=Roseiconus nitratireducens TaxID=2605748 RepID=A0A5M6DC58_9BACT|nr:hypothetical protein [Roseiconus nitratireducens]KAA5545134.1 hypothetical protein FYK55_05515 [Roseiconus nitratireducens]
MPTFWPPGCQAAIPAAVFSQAASRCGPAVLRVAIAAVIGLGVIGLGVIGPDAGRRNGTAVLHAWEPSDSAVARGESALELVCPLLSESSGLAFSGVDRSCFWTHNDSGDQARMFAFDADGTCCGQLTLANVDAVDWEDAASFRDDQVSRLLVADVGDNDGRRRSVVLYLFDEPDPRSESRVKAFQTLEVTYADGPHDCEAVAVDPANRRILMLTKSVLFTKLYELPLPARGAAGAKGGVRRLVAKPVGAVAIPLASGMDRCPLTGDLWVTGYLQAFRFKVPEDASLVTTIRQVPQVIDLPKLRQVEAIAVDDRGQVWVTSEGRPAKLQRLSDSGRSARDPS